jgi:hypothetical protein
VLVFTGTDYNDHNDGSKECHSTAGWCRFTLTSEESTTTCCEKGYININEHERLSNFILCHILFKANEQRNHYRSHIPHIFVDIHCMWNNKLFHNCFTNPELSHVPQLQHTQCYQGCDHNINAFFSK